MKALLGSEPWKWHGTACYDSECEIDFVSPEDTVRVLLERTYRTREAVKPVVLLLSALEDEETQALMEAFPEIRLVLLGPESLMLGRGSRANPPEDPDDSLAARLSQRQGADKYSGDLGMSATLNPEHKAATQLIARPEWLGETAAHLSARLTYDVSQAEWSIDSVATAVNIVPGAALQWAAANCTQGMPAGSDCTRFWMTWPEATGKLVDHDYGVFRSYLACDEGKTPPAGSLLFDQCAKLASLANPAEFLAFAGDAFRRATGSEIALVPGALIDPDGFAWLKSVLAPGWTRIMTRFVLERLIYRSFRIVRTTVAGSDLVATLDKALAASSHAGSCIVGLEGGCVSKVDTKRADRLFVNDRLLDPRLYYSIAMPEGLAAELGLEHSDGRHTADAVSVLNERLTDLHWYVADRDPDVALSTRLVRSGEGKLQFHSIASSFEFGYINLDLGEPAARKGTIDTTDISFRSITPARTLVGKATIDIAAIDLPRLAIRGIAESDFKRRTDIKTTIKTENGVESEVDASQLAFEANQMLFGGRADWKLRPFRREGRVYGGYFVEGEIQGPPKYLTAKIERESEDGFKMTRTASGVTQFQRQPLRFRYLAAGVDIANIATLFSQGMVPIKLTKAACTVGMGRTQPRAVHGVAIDGVEQDRQLFTDKGPQGVLDKVFGDSIDTFDPDVTFVALTQSRDQRRLQGELIFEPTVKIGKKIWKFATELNGKHYPTVADSEPNSVAKYFSAKFSLALPIVERLELVPTYQKQWADVHNGGNGYYTQDRFELVVKVPFVVKAGWGWLLR